MNRRFSRRGFAVIVMMTGALAGWAQQGAPRGAVVGVVTRGGTVAAGAPVKLLAVFGYTATTSTDRKGNFAFSGVPLGDIQVSVLDPDGNPIASAKTTLKTPDQTATVSVSLP